LPLLLRSAADICVLVDGGDQGGKGGWRYRAHDGDPEELGEHWKYDCVCDWRCACPESDADGCGVCTLGDDGAIYATGGVW
nr:hypothetical protein [Tanacetum cinerariifolium]